MLHKLRSGGGGVETKGTHFCHEVTKAMVVFVVLLSNSGRRTHIGCSARVGRATLQATVATAIRNKEKSSAAALCLVAALGA
jgi:hypothetical protein